MSPSICIDFGASYTKIAYREDPNQPSQLLGYESLSLDPDHVCIPTVAAWRERDDRWVFGIDAADLHSGNGVRVFSNWKPLLFEPAPEFRVAEDIEEDDEWNGEPIQGADTPHALARRITQQFFAWLKKDLVPQMLGRPVLDDITLRVAVPEFVMYSPEATDFEGLVTKAGWLSPGIICISEPVSNLIGSLSRGRNKVVPVRNGKSMPAVQEMFTESEFLKFIDDDLDVDREGDQHCILVVDVGNFTTDFGLINIDLEERGFFPLTESHSIALGVSKLEQWVKKLLPQQAKESYSALSVRDRERLRTVVYGQGKSWQMPDGTGIGQGKEGDEIKQAIRAMADQVIEGVEEFLKLNGISHVGEVILTGGGNNMPGLASRLAEHFSTMGIPALHGPAEIAMSQTLRNIPLDQKIVRGASALGGTSVLFDA